MNKMTLGKLRQLALGSMVSYDRIFFFVGVPVGTCLGLLPLMFSFVTGVTDVIAKTPEEIRNLRIFGIGLSILLLVAAIEHLLKKKKDVRLFQSLSKGLTDIVWIYKEVSKGKIRRSNGAGGAQLPLAFCHMQFCFVDRKKHHIDVTEAQADELTGFLVDNYPHILVGYSDEAEKAFIQDPSKLRSISVDPKKAAVRTGTVLY